MTTVRFRVRIGDREVDLAEGMTVIGSGEECDIRLDDERLAGKHAMLLVDGRQAYIADMGGGAGTLVNREPIHDDQRLEAGDVIKIGQSEVLFQIASATRPTPAEVLQEGKATVVDAETVAEADHLQDAFARGALEEAESLLMSLVVDLLEAPPSHASHPRLQVAVEGLLTLAEKRVDAIWLHRVFQLYLTGEWWMSNEIQKRVERLVRAVGRIEGNGLTHYLAYWEAREADLTAPDRAQLDRLAQLRPSSDGEIPALAER